MEKAWPRRGTETRRLIRVKSAGWNTLLPRPATAAAANRAAKPEGAATRRPAADSSATPPQSTRCAPKRSTTKPASAWPMPEITKNTVIRVPTSAKPRPKSFMNQGNSGGSSRWKKCEVAWAKPIRDITVASALKEVAPATLGAVADISALYGCLAYPRLAIANPPPTHHQPTTNIPRRATSNWLCDKIAAFDQRHCSRTSFKTIQTLRGILMFRITLSRTIVASVAIIARLASSQATAQAYPNKPIKIIVPFAPGGGSDFIARFIAQRLQTALGQPVIIDNRPGAGGNIGTEAGVTSPPDGYTLTLIASSYTTNQAIYKAKYDPNNDITPIIQLSQGPMLLVSNVNFAPNTAKEFIALTKAKPDEVTFASAGTGSITHMTGELFANTAGVKMNHIPYKGSGPAMTDTIGGQTNVFFSTTAESISQVNAGKLKAIGVTTTKRLAALPNVPTIAESGLSG